MNAVLTRCEDAAHTTDRGLVCAPVDATGKSILPGLRRCSWAEIHDSARAVAGGLQAAGVVPGDAVAVLAGSPSEVAALVQGVWMCGASVTMVHHPTHR